MFKKTYFFLLFLVLMYGLIPIGLSTIIGADFLIGDIIDNELILDLIVLTICTSFFLSPLLTRDIFTLPLSRYGRFFEKVGYNFYITYLLFLVILGLILRAIGEDRATMLSILSSTFIQGMGIVFILFYLKFIKSSFKSILFVALLFILIDILFMGKQYFIALITILIFLADYYNIKIKLIHLIFIAFLSITFVFIINYTRGDFEQIDLYSSLMEFRGVVSSIQFASPGVSIFRLNEFRSYVENNSIDIFGYNLAFHPLMYFRSITNYTILNIVIYSMILFLLHRLMIKLIGIYAILLIALNFIHFLRHGVDLFLIKLIFQFFIVFLLRVKFDLNEDKLKL